MITRRRIRMVDKRSKMMKFLENLSDEGVRQVTFQLALYPESREFIEKCAEEFWQATDFPKFKK